MGHGHNVVAGARDFLATTARGHIAIGVAVFVGVKGLEATDPASAEVAC